MRGPPEGCTCEGETGSLRLDRACFSSRLPPHSSHQSQYLCSFLSAPGVAEPPLCSQPALLTFTPFSCLVGSLMPTSPHESCPCQGPGQPWIRVSGRVSHPVCPLAPGPLAPPSGSMGSRHPSPHSPAPLPSHLPFPAPVVPPTLSPLTLPLWVLLRWFRPHQPVVTALCVQTLETVWRWLWGNQQGTQGGVGQPPKVGQ